ncbi:MAG TPA: hypothetical protein PK971_02835, partial [Saprospiraceae bacterium]|nr:hypothetical protein [Saprospiraceae bacterium]
GADVFGGHKTNVFGHFKKGNGSIGVVPDPVYQPNQGIQNEPHTLAQYQGYTERRDGLRPRCRCKANHKTPCGSTGNGWISPSASGATAAYF